MARRKGRRRPTRSRGRNAKTRHGLTGPTAAPTPFVRRGRARRGHYTFVASGGLELGGQALVAYRPAVLPGVGFFVFRRPARHYHYETTGGLVLGGIASVAYRPAARRYAHAAAGGLLLGGGATVRYRPAPVPVPTAAARDVWARLGEHLALADDPLDALLADGDEAHLLLLPLEEDTALDRERTVTRSADGNSWRILEHERDDADRLADKVCSLFRQGMCVDSAGRFVFPVPSDMREADLLEVLGRVRDRLQTRPLAERPAVLTWARDDPAPAVATAMVPTRKPGAIGFRSSAR